METNNKEKIVNYDKLTENEKALIDDLLEECAIIFASAVLRIEKAIDRVKEELYEGDKEKWQN